MRAERRNQVLAAYVSAVSKHGLSGATLENIAQEADLKRPLVRHHLGNKQAMFEQLVTYVIDAFSRQTRQLADALPMNGRVQAMIDILFDGSDDTTPELVFAFAELTLKSVSDRALAERLAASVTEFENFIAAEIQRAFGSAPASETRAVAHGIMAIYFNRVSLAPIADAGLEARDAIEILLQSLVERQADQ